MPLNKETKPNIYVCVSVKMKDGHTHIYKYTQIYSAEDILGVLCYTFFIWYFFSFAVSISIRLLLFLSQLPITLVRNPQVNQ